MALSIVNNAPIVDSGIKVPSRPSALETAKKKLETENTIPSVSRPKVNTQSVPTLSELDARAYLLRQQTGAGLYDRSLTYREGAATLKRQDAIAAYAKQIQAKEGGPTEKDLRVLSRKLDNAQKQIDRLSTNDRGADLDSVAGIDGKELDTVQANLMARIEAGVKDGSLTEDEAVGLLAKQAELGALEKSFRESGGKLTAGEQKMVLDELRKEADLVNKLRHNDVGVNRTGASYSDQIDARQANLEKQLAAAVKSGTVLEDEAQAIRAEFDKAQSLENDLRADSRVDWRDATKMSTALNNVEIKLYDLQRNRLGVQLADSFVDVKYADQRQAQQLEGIARGIDNRSLTDVEARELLGSMQKVQNQEDRQLAGDGKLDRAEYLRLQNAMNDLSLRNQELASNRDRWTGLLPNPVQVPPAPVKPAPAPVNTGDGNGSGNGSGSGNGNGGVTVGPAPAPATAPAPAAETKPVVAEEASKDEAPATTPDVKPVVASDDGPSAPVINWKPEAIEDRFAEMMTGAMRHLGDKVRDIYADLDERRDARKEDGERREVKKHFPYAQTQPNHGIGQILDRVNGVDRSQANHSEHQEHEGRSKNKAA